MGTTQMFTALAQDEASFADKLSLFVALGPVTKITNTKSQLLQLASTFYRELETTSNLLGIHNLFGNNWLTDGTMDLFCTHIDTLCKAVESFFVTDKTDLDDD